MKYSLEQLEIMPFHLLTNIDIKDEEDERLVQQVINKRKLEMPIEIDLNITSAMTDSIKTPEDEARVQAEIDARKEELRKKLLPTEEVTGSEPVVLIQEETVSSSEAPKKFCEFCDAKGPIKHKKICPTLSAKK